MYQPKFNHVLVEIDDKDAEWGKSSDENLGGQVYREGKLLAVADRLFSNESVPVSDLDLDEVKSDLEKLIGKQIMWNEGHEAGTVFEENGKKYCLIYWHDVIGAKNVK